LIYLSISTVLLQLGTITSVPADTRCVSHHATAATATIRSKPNARPFSARNDVEFDHVSVSMKRAARHFAQSLRIGGASSVRRL
jgi:hypothetical protein